MIFNNFFRIKDVTPKVKNGRWKEFNKHAILISEGNYVNDIKQGVWKEYFDTGELMIEEYYRDGVQHGKYISYHRNGVMLSQGKLVMGSREGEFKVYDWDGNHIRSLWFADNNLIAELDTMECRIGS